MMTREEHTVLMIDELAFATMLLVESRDRLRETEPELAARIDAFFAKRTAAREPRDGQ